jgi:hypothetical protein
LRCGGVGVVACGLAGDQIIKFDGLFEKTITVQNMFGWKSI